MPSQVTATVVVNFSTSGGGQLTAEIDDRPGGYNNGNTNFVAGDSPAFLVWASSDVTITNIETSADDVGASIVPIQMETMLMEEDLQFADVAEVSLQKPYYNGIEFKWLGNNLGTPTPSEGAIRIPAAGVGVLRISYLTIFRVYRVLDIPSQLNGETTFPVLIVVSGTKA